VFERENEREVYSDGGKLSGKFPNKITRISQDDFQVILLDYLNFKT
jgi:hypothetical protein